MESQSTCNSEIFLNIDISKIKKEIFMGTFDTLMQNQARYRLYNKDFKAVKDRKEVIESFLLKSCRNLDLKESTFCLSICLFDQIISRFKINPKMMIPTCIVILGISIKFNETRQIPYDVLFFVNDLTGIKKKIYLVIEQRILKMTNFKLKMISPLDFLNMFLLIKPVYYFPQKSDSKSLFGKENFKILAYKMNRIISLDYNSNKYTSVCIATIAIMCARYFLNAKVVLPNEITVLTNLHFKNIFEIFNQYLVKIKLYWSME